MGEPVAELSLYGPRPVVEAGSHLMLPLFWPGIVGQIEKKQNWKLCLQLVSFLGHGKIPKGLLQVSADG